jgi:hypothetical protein
MLTANPATWNTPKTIEGINHALQFTGEASHRMATVVRKVERTPTSLVGDRIPRYG